MSGHAVIIPVLLPAVTTGVVLAAVGGAAAGLGFGVKRILDERIEAARAATAREKSQNDVYAELRRALGQRDERRREIERRIRDAENRLAALDLGLALPAEDAQAGSPAAPSTRGYLHVAAARLSPVELASMLGEIASSVAALPAEFREEEAAAYAQFVAQRDQFMRALDGDRAVSREELAEFAQTVSRALKNYLEESTMRGQRRVLLAERLEKALDDVCFHERLAASPRLPLEAEYADLAALREQLLRVMASENLSEGSVEVIEARLATLREAVGRVVVETAHRQGLCEAVAGHLADMGYDTLEAFPDEYHRSVLEACLRIPGGERVRVMLHPNNQLGFQVIHERSGAEAGLESLTPEEFEVLRRQETRWCGDLRELFRRLIAENFVYEIRFEDIIPAESVKVVVVETGEELAEESETAFRGGEPRHLKLS